MPSPAHDGDYVSLGLLGEAPTSSPAPRVWRGGVCQCLGDYSPHHVATCLGVAAGAGPCIWGVTQRRVSGGGVAAAAAWSALLTLLLVVPNVLYKCVLYVYWNRAETTVRANAMQVTPDDDAAGRHLFALTVQFQRFAVAVAFVAFVCTLVVAVVAGRRRTRLRRALGVPGSACGDCCAWWWCAPCAMCQEARTAYDAPMNEGVLGAKAGDALGGAASGVPGRQEMGRV